MALRSPSEFKDGLNDGRVIYYRGEKVQDVVAHDDLGIGVEHVALDYELAEDSDYSALYTWHDTELNQPCSRYFKIPESSEDLLTRRKMIEESTRLGDAVVLLIKEIGSDALFALDLVTSKIDLECNTGYRDNVKAFLQECKINDFSLAVAQTDVKGNRSLLPSDQEHADYYVHIVEERPDGIVVRGAKAHTTCAPVSYTHLRAHETREDRGWRRVG